MYIVAFPVSNHYYRYLNPSMKESYYNTLDKIDGTIHVIDFNECNLFDDSNFNDMDHLNDNRAIKATNLILNILDSFSSKNS